MTIFLLIKELLTLKAGKQEAVLFLRLQEQLLIQKIKNYKL